VREFLQQRLDLEDSFTFVVPGPLDLAGLMPLTGTPGFESLRYEPWPPCSSPDVDPAEPLFATIARRDVLLYHPYESFEPVVRFLEEAADDPDVLAIKQTLYRTSSRSPIVAALRRAAQKGKYVTALVELKARFDEARNIEWAKDLERNGVQVIYGVKGLKTHAKICLVVRREPQGLVRYMHFGTGNYNEQTSRLYSDASLMTCHEELGADATSFFHAITGYSQPQRYRKIEAAPISLRERLLEMIEIEIAHRQQGQKALILLKLNALVDEAMIAALYAASQAGVRIRCNIRGICCLRPGVPGLSEHITVTSVVDRYLEHSRILYFHHGGDERLYISSADWMPRNLDRRVELLVPVESTSAKNELLSILKVHLHDTVKAWRLRADGHYERVEATGSEDRLHSQAELHRRVCAAVRDARQLPVSMFEPHRAPGQED
jgi:polyphosphate kinase